MSRFLSEQGQLLRPYTPGEQPQDKRYNKLNTNESPFPPSPRVLAAVNEAETARLQLYSDPTCAVFCEAVARRLGVAPETVIPGNGSDELLSFAFRVFCGSDVPAVYPDITYGFYQALARYYNVPVQTVPLREDFSLCIDDFLPCQGTVFLANPNAPTGIALPAAEIERLVAADPNRLVIVDEAYVDFGAESCVPLTLRYENLLVIQTLSKSRSLAGGRIGFAVGSRALIDDMNRAKYSFNPYNLNRLSILAGAAAMDDQDYFAACCAAVMQTRAWTVAQLSDRGFTVLPSAANFIFASSPAFPDGALYRRLKERGILVRHFDASRIRDWYRISIGSREQMTQLIETIDQLRQEDCV